MGLGYLFLIALAFIFVVSTIYTDTAGKDLISMKIEHQEASPSSRGIFAASYVSVLPSLLSLPVGNLSVDIDRKWYIMHILLKCNWKSMFFISILI